VGLYVRDFLRANEFVVVGGTPCVLLRGVLIVEGDGALVERSGVVFRPSIREDSRAIAELFSISSHGVVDYVWSTLAPEYPGLEPVEIGAVRYAREEGNFSYTNCVVAELGGEVIGQLCTYPVEAGALGERLQRQPEQAQNLRKQPQAGDGHGHRPDAHRQRRLRTQRTHAVLGKEQPAR
jgi:hypothetical protein